MNNETYLYEKEPRDPFDLKGWQNLEKEMEIEVARLPDRKEAQNHLDYVRKNIYWLKENAPNLRQAA